MTFGQQGSKPDRIVPMPKRGATNILAEAAAALDLRRQAQISNQIDSINRLMVDGTYDGEMAALQRALAEQTAALFAARAALASAREGIKNQLVIDKLQAVSDALSPKPLGEVE